jgi:hypothetical protein
MLLILIGLFLIYVGSYIVISGVQGLIKCSKLKKSLKRSEYD